jgi:flavin-dependent dehydrogenase
VILCEASEFPRVHVGISLNAGVCQQLAYLALDGLLDRPEHRHGVPVERRWGSDHFEPTTSTFAILADRGVFDADILRAARDAGVKVLQPAAVRVSERASDLWRLEVSCERACVPIEATFVIDAAGRRSHHRRRQRYGAATLALCGTWRGVPAKQVRISAQPVFWSWGAPTGPNSSVLVCFVDPLDLRRPTMSLRERYLELARACGVLGDLADRSLTADPVTCDATPYLAQGEVEGLLRVGDADMALDPLSSCGVQAAIQSALMAGPIINTILTPSQDAAAALQFWRNRRSLTMQQHCRWTEQFYRDAFARHTSRFWADRCARLPPPAPSVLNASPLLEPEQFVRLSDGVRFVRTPCLNGPFVQSLECVDHPGLVQPVAFFAGIHAAPLLRQATLGAPAKDIFASWSASMSPRVARSLLNWAWRHGLLVPAVADEARQAIGL